ncbi:MULTISPECIES: ABC transporter substrate-binding protein [Cytobacillus]|jgi:ABC-type nitrate/sulfonate/bicarbonate transport system substrate-binding protein|uniref:ABC transporter substrate-binding protein n=3 Tax=Cytobacillus TaxID=2675230 RepID=A0A160MA76_9BACI|nr:MULTISPECIES: ABC transporter substrate-binding protein [Cytobacillus]MBY0159533.1 ABC transporter substrate-binding protein [Cytobacillus firmus]AND39098.1 ABC transporter substrate-binding protein [Cytobacillus oceanisediminis 2691]MBU8768241.1 ABC transporter substrate-binding protein [Cytobacillus oceanisediminis]MCM3241521.1 ABC transporter substrate-binding protein [Cytobacillus oceanisediminis]MCM3391936.1 ABC transporter substrate-binding protein [Cytobacillus oceanisediminis]
MKKWIAAICSLLLLSGCAGNGPDNQTGSEDSDSKQDLKKVTVVLDWTPNTNHTGLYAAKDKGYFKEEGLDVEIIMPGEAGADQLTASGKADFGVSYQESITEARVQGVPLVSIAAVIQHNTSGFASPAEKNIKSPKDFEGKTYGGWGAPVEKSVIDSLMKKENANIDKVSIVNMGDADFFTAVKRDIDFAWIYYGWTGVEAELRGEKINMVYLTDYSEKLDYYTPVLATSEKMIADDPDTVKAFVKAAARGYEFAIDQPGEAADILLKNAPDLDSELVKKSQEWLSPRYQDDASRWGEQKLEVWENYADWMHENGLLDKELDAGKAFTNDFLPE